MRNTKHYGHCLRRVMVGGILALALSPCESGAQLLDNFDVGNTAGTQPVNWTFTDTAVDKNFLITTTPPSTAVPFTSPNAVYAFQNGGSGSAPVMNRSFTSANAFTFSFDIIAGDSSGGDSRTSNIFTMALLNTSVVSRIQMALVLDYSNLTLFTASSPDVTAPDLIGHSLTFYGVWNQSGWNSVAITQELNGDVSININGTVSNFTASPNTVDTVSFSVGWSGASTNYLSYLDNVSVLAIPEPGSIALCAVGCLLFLARKRGKKGVQDHCPTTPLS